MKVAVIIAAGGIGKRMGMDRPKQYLDLLGRSIICHTLERFAHTPDITKVIVVLPPADVKTFEKEFLETCKDIKNCEVTAGGEKRQDSVRNGLKLVPNDYDIVLVHDACRPFISQSLIEETIKAAWKEGAAIVAAPLKETIKRVSNDGHICETVDRLFLWGAQTPQAFRCSLLMRAMDAAYQDGFWGTDEATLIERIGFKVRIIKGDSRNIKITTPQDLVIARALAESWPEK